MKMGIKGGKGKLGEFDSSLQCVQGDFFFFLFKKRRERRLLLERWLIRPKGSSSLPDRPERGGSASICLHLGTQGHGFWSEGLHCRERVCVGFSAGAQDLR